MHASLWLPVSYLALVCIPLSVFDLREHRLPNPLTYPAIGLASIAVVWLLLEGEYQNAVASLIAGAGTFGIGYWMARAELVGMGDVKLLTSNHAILAAISPVFILVSLFSAFALATAFNMAQLVAGRISLRSPVAMGPFLLLGFFFAVGLSSPLVA